MSLSLSTQFSSSHPSSLGLFSESCEDQSYPLAYPNHVIGCCPVLDQNLISLLHTMIISTCSPSWIFYLACSFQEFLTATRCSLWPLPCPLAKGFLRLWTPFLSAVGAYHH